MNVTAAMVASEPARFQLDRYSPLLGAAEVARYWTVWLSDQVLGRPSPALCRRCGQVLRFHDDGAQVHDWCNPFHPVNGGGEGGN